MRILPHRRSARTGLLLIASALVFSPSLVRADGKPARPDSSPKIRPKSVTMTTAVVPAQARAGETVSFRVTARLDPGFHIYSTTTPPGGPKKTEFDLFDIGGLKVAGGWTSSKEPTKEPSALFGGAIVEYFSDEVTWSIPLLVPPGTAPGKVALQVQAQYMVCDDTNCSIPGRWTLPPAEVTIAPGGQAEAATPAVAPPAEVETAAAPAPTRGPDAPAEAGAGAATSAPAPASNEVQRAREAGLIPFLLLAAGGGLLALVMPCVWPMVPITVNFFVKQGQAEDRGKGGRSKALELAITYCLAIIGIYTLVGVLFSALFGATYLQNLANAAWLNIAVAALFLYFGLSLLGLYEIRLPSFLLNASAQGESRGGLVGVIFMALTLTITSFTCTFPVVGGLLVMAAGGDYLYPVLGLATFATVLALPFFLLALAPGLISRVPRSGDWMNAVKVVGGLIEIGAAFKFINTAEVAFVPPDEAWFDAHTVLTVWVVLSAICGIYLLGLFRTDHDHEPVQVGPGRMIFGSIFLVLALYFAPALFGRPPQGRLYYLAAGFFPADAVSDFRPAIAAGSGEGAAEVKATSTDPKAAEREQTAFHGVAWGMSYEAALERARAEGKPILIDFTGVNCANCRQMEVGVFPRPEIVGLLKQFVTVQLYTDYVPIGSITADQREELAQANQVRLIDLAHETTNPAYVVLSPQGEVLSTIGGARPVAVFADFLRSGLERFGRGAAVAQAGG